MILEEIKPFVRYARVMEVDEKMGYPNYCPIDCRLFYVEEGEGKIKTPDGTFIMPKGSVLIIHSGCFYEICAKKARYLALNFDYTYENKDITIPVPPVPVKSKGKPELLENVKFKDFPALNTYFFSENMFFLKSLLAKMIDEYSKKHVYHETVLSAYLISTIVQAVRKPRNDMGGEKNLDMIISCIHGHYNEPLTNSTLAEIYHFHPNYVSSLFKKNFGKSLHQYVIDVRISNAIAMLESGKQSIEEIAAATGFYDSSYFSRYFKKMTGVSPKVYKR